ncbi:hypothetical protein IB211_01191c [Intestinimonas butyriciproducens]|uniref:Uncharacterized protein n=1 Tax=Intestinimonas butyriciproducens TaxID=1297617 RepID=A0A0S2W3G6_9FIRM|nr:hypothetical protein IB211_01191c [Intestinimonas butyriciproducens]
MHGKIDRKLFIFVGTVKPAYLQGKARLGTLKIRFVMLKL